MKTVKDKDFVYVNSAHTDIRRTFARARKRMKEEADAKARVEAEQKEKVRQLKD